MSSPFLGEIRIFAGNFAPRGYALCNGQLLPINQNTALFSLLGTTYGGNGQTTFALPNLQERFPMHHGQGPGLSPRALGEVSGSATVTLQESQIPAHTHVLLVSTANATRNAPSANSALALSPATVYGLPQDLVPLATEALQPTGGGQPHANVQPYLAVTYVIAIQGIFPSRN